MIAPTCPRCGQVLLPVVVQGGEPPWRCNKCYHAWWDAELAPGAITDYSHNHFEFHWASDVPKHRDKERTLAHMRGVSTNVSQLPLLTPGQLRQAKASAHPRAIEFIAAVDKELETR